MTYGFRISNANGQPIFQLSDQALLFIDQFTVSSGTVTRTYVGGASKTINIIRVGTNSVSSKCTITQTTSGSDRIFTITVAREGYFIATME